MIIELKGISDLAQQIDELKEKLFADGHLLLRGLFTKEELNEVRKEFQTVYSRLEARGTTKVAANEIVDNDLLKYSVGQFSGAQTMARLFLILYRKEENLSTIERIVFDKLIKIYEIIQGKAFSKEQLEASDSFFTKRYQFYPSGGGFIGTHADTFNIETTKRLGGEFIQFVLPITQKGIDYSEGGGYTMSNGELVSNEEDSELGDLIVYDGSIEHGVADIEPSKPLDMNPSSGRIVMLTTLYKKMQ
jgi:hypothetical protein